MQRVGGKGVRQPANRVDHSNSPHSPRRQRSVDNRFDRDVMHEIGTKSTIETEQENQRLRVFEWVGATARERQANILEAMTSYGAGLAGIASYDDNLHSS